MTLNNNAFLYHSVIHFLHGAKLVGEIMYAQCCQKLCAFLFGAACAFGNMLSSIDRLIIFIRGAEACLCVKSDFLPMVIDVVE